MMQKLKFYICLIAVLLLSTQVLTAQITTAIEQVDPTSAVGGVTNGRFGSDVDNFFSVNDWADVELSKWFGYLNMADIDIATANSTNSNPDANPFFTRVPDVWEGGLALKLSKAYVGLYYYGRFNSGSQYTDWDQVTYTDGQGGTRTGPTLSSLTGSSPSITFPTLTGVTATPSATAGGITRRNYFGVLLGIGNHGFKVAVLDNLRTIDLPYVKTTGLLAAGTGTLNKQDIPAETTGSYRFRDGAITPMIQWGAAQDMTFGKYATRPSASLSLKVDYSSNWELFNLTTEDGENLDDISNYDNASSGATIMPKIGIDTGGIKFFTGDWGTLSFGLGNEFAFLIEGKGKSPQEGTTLQDGTPTWPSGASDYVPWENKLFPYAIFAYQASEHFSLGVKLNIPIWFGADDSNNSFFGVGARGNGATTITGGNAYEADYPTLGFGFQLKGAVLDKLVEKVGIFDKLSFNWGIKVNLPGYLYYGYYNYNVSPDPPVDGTPTVTTITKAKQHQWLSPPGGANAAWLQELYTGVTFYLTPKALIDAGIVKYRPAGSTFTGELSFVNTPIYGRVLISVKH